MKVIKYLILIAVLVAAGAVSVQAGEKADLTAGQVQFAVALFKDQKAEFLAQQKEAKNYAKKVRAEVRERRATEKAGALAPVRDEARKSIEDAKLQAVEQGRKLAEESAAIARDARRSGQ